MKLIMAFYFLIMNFLKKENGDKNEENKFTFDNNIIYIALNTQMLINGDFYIRIKNNIRITNIKVLEQTQGVYEPIIMIILKLQQV